MDLEQLLFCHIGCMARYEGLEGKTDNIVGGGKYVDENEFGHEICNFLQCGDGYVYGHVETIRGERDCNINIERLGANPQDNYADNVTVFWTALNPDHGGRYIIGWYQNACVFRKRQSFTNSPSTQHKLDEIKTYRIKARADDTVLIPIEHRDILLGTGKGWMGHHPCWYPHDQNNPEIGGFVNQLPSLLEARGREWAAQRQIMSGSTLNTTQKKALIQARVGQGKFRQDLFEEWRGCSVTGCENRDLLRASHIKPWSQSNNSERLDTNNGLLLFVGLDAAFDSGLISFKNSGQILVSPQLSNDDRVLLGLTDNNTLRQQPSNTRKPYLKYHRENIFRG